MVVSSGAESPDISFAFGFAPWRSSYPSTLEKKKPSWVALGA